MNFIREEVNSSTGPGTIVGSSNYVFNIINMNRIASGLYFNIEITDTATGTRVDLIHITFHNDLVPGTPEGPTHIKINPYNNPHQSISIDLIIRYIREAPTTRDGRRFNHTYFLQPVTSYMNYLHGTHSYTRIEELTLDRPPYGGPHNLVKRQIYAVYMNILLQAIGYSLGRAQIHLDRNSNDPTRRIPRIGRPLPIIDPVTGSAFIGRTASNEGDVRFREKYLKYKEKYLKLKQQLQYKN